MDMDLDDMQARKMLGLANYSHPNSHFGLDNMTSFLSRNGG